jgi:hypothetical protein
MKQVLMALAITAFAYCSAEAQVCKCPKTVRHTAARLRVKKQDVALQQSCRLLPFEVCTINPDRRSVSCFQTTDPNAVKPLNNETTNYGATGALPGQVEKPDINTIVINNSSKGDYCIRDDQGKATICYHQGGLLTRDEDGYYHYR